MADTYFKPLRCSAEIPLSPFDGVVCNALADVIVQEGPRCDSCLAEFAGTPLDDGEPETMTPEQMATDARFLSTHWLEISVPCHVRGGGQ